MPPNSENSAEETPRPRTPRSFDRTRYCSHCQKEEPARVQIYDYAGRDVYVYILKCGRTLSDVPIPPHETRERLSRFETLTAGGTLWRIYRQEWVLAPMNLMRGQWYFEPENYFHTRDPFSDSYNSRELAEQAILDLLSAEGSPSPTPAQQHSTGSRILARLAKTAGAAMARIRKHGPEYWSVYASPAWADRAIQEGMDRKTLVTHLRSPHLPERAGALYALLCMNREGGLVGYRHEWLGSLRVVFKPPVADQGRMFRALARFAAHYLNTMQIGEDEEGSDLKRSTLIWPLTCELYSSTLDPIMSRLVGARAISRYEFAVRVLADLQCPEIQNALDAGPDLFTIETLDQFQIVSRADILDIPGTLLPVALRCAVKCLPERALAEWNVGAVPVQITARNFLARIEMGWLLKAKADVREECVQLIESGRDYSGMLKKSFEKVAERLDPDLLRRAGVSSDRSV